MQTINSPCPCQIIDIFRTKRGAAVVGRVVDDVIDQTEVAIHEIIPGARLVSEAALQQGAIDSRECHVCIPRW